MKFLLPFFALFFIVEISAQSKSGCPLGYYSYIYGKICKICDTSCKTCSGAGPTACTTCFEGDPVNGVCN